jgi:hypothetical protein
MNRTRRTAACAALTALLAALTCLMVAPPPATAAHVSGDELWRAIYDGPTGFNDMADALVLAPGGAAVYVAGSVTPADSVYSDVGLIKYRPGGSRVWLRTYDGAAHGNDDCAALVRDGAGNIYVGGFTQKAATGEDYLSAATTMTASPPWPSTRPATSTPPAL